MAKDSQFIIDNKDKFNMIINTPTQTIDTTLFNEIVDDGQNIEFKNTIICDKKIQFEIKKTELDYYLSSGKGSVLVKSKKGFPWNGDPIK